MIDALASSRERILAVGVVVYRSEPSLLQRLRCAIDADFDVYLFDNSPEDGTVRGFAEVNPRCHYNTCGKNLGLGVGISAVCSQAFYAGFAALLFFDQDTVFDAHTLAFVARFASLRQDMSRSYSAVVFNAKRGAPLADADVPIRDVVMAISSGTMFFLSNLRKLNWHNASYFVDCADYEFCFKSELHGLKIAEVSCTPGFDHLSEQPDRTYRLLGRNHAVRRYSASRVRGTLWASTRLIMAALRAGRLRFAALMIRSVSVYATFQVIARLVAPSRSEQKDSR